MSPKTGPEPRRVVAGELDALERDALGGGAYQQAAFAVALLAAPPTTPP